MNYIYKVIVESDDPHESPYKEYIFTKEDNATYCYNRLIKRYADDKTVTEEKLPDYCQTNYCQTSMKRFIQDGYADTIYLSIMETDDEYEEDIMAKETITESQAKEYWRDLIGAFYHGKPPKGNTGILYVFGIANWLNITEEKAKEICNAWVKYGITERQGGGLVV